MDLCKKMDLRKIKCWIVNKYKILLVCGIFAIIGLILMTNALVDIKTENDNMSLAVQKWYDQLPEEHWIKSEENKYFNQKYFQYQLIDVYEQLKNESHTLTKLSYVVMGQEEKVGKIFAKAMETADSYNERKFCLKNNEGKSIKRINLKIGEDYTVFFCYDETKMLLDFSEEEYINEISHFEPNSIPLANRIAFSYSDNPEIATIFNGHIIGISKGKTTIHFLSNGYFFSYEIKVK